MLDQVIKGMDFLGYFTTRQSGAVPYAVLPNADKPRWLVPLKNNAVTASSLALYQPSLIQAKFIKRLALLLVSAGLGRLFMKESLYFVQNDEVIKMILNKGELYYAVFTGTEGNHRKITVQVMDEEGKILAYVKIADNDILKDLVDNEAQILNYLYRHDITKGHVPRVLYHGKVSGREILATDTIKGEDARFSSKLSPKHVDFLLEIFIKTAVTRKFDESEFWSDLVKRVGAVNGRMRAVQGERFDTAIAFIQKMIGNDEVPFGLCHRDFTPWNTFIKNGRLYVFDWEYAKVDYPPLFDLLHFVLQDGVVVRKRNAMQLRKTAAEYAALIAVYRDALNISMRLINALWLCYLMDISLLYIERERDGVREECARSIDVWGRLMDLIMVEGC